MEISNYLARALPGSKLTEHQPRLRARYLICQEAVSSSPETPLQ